jgi:hypothetical protein
VVKVPPVVVVVRPRSHVHRKWQYLFLSSCQFNTFTLASSSFAKESSKAIILSRMLAASVKKCSALAADIKSTSPPVLISLASGYEAHHRKHEHAN